MSEDFIDDNVLNLSLLVGLTGIGGWFVTVSLVRE